MSTPELCADCAEGLHCGKACGCAPCTEDAERIRGRDQQDLRDALRYARSLLENDPVEILGPLAVLLTRTERALNLSPGEWNALHRALTTGLAFHDALRALTREMRDELGGP